MAHSKNKQQILNTQMHKLGLGGAFNGWFFYKKTMIESEVITVTEFIALNQRLLTSNESFICGRTDQISQKLFYRGMRKARRSWSKLKTFLTKNGFDYNDWIMLIPEIKTPRGVFPDFASLKKKMLLKVPIRWLTGIKESTGGYTSIRGTLQKDEDILVEDIINISLETVTDLLIWKPTLQCIQRKLKEYGFAKKDGRFMGIDLGLKTTHDYFKELTEKRKFNSRDARQAIELGIRAGWIKV